MQKRIINSNGRKLEDLHAAARGHPAFAEDSASLYRTVCDSVGGKVLVDSPKSLLRLKELRNHTDLVIVPIFLRRDAAGVVNSNVRKGRSWFRMTLKHYSGTRRKIEYFRTIRHIAVDYSALTRDPRSVLRRVMAEIGLGFEESQLSWADKPNHAINGNRMRFSRDSTVRPDDAWRSKLTVFQKMTIRLFTNDYVLESDAVAAVAKFLRPFLRGRKSRGNSAAQCQ